MRKRKKMLWIITGVVMALVAVSFGVYKWMNARSFQVAGDIVTHAETDSKEVALTFDDGPTEYTQQILDMLDELDVKGTFFLIGEAIQSHMEEAKAIVDAGHQVGSHAYSHQRMVFRSGQFIADELDKTNDLLRQAGYEGEIMFRPPYGKKLVLLPLALQERDMTTVMWSREPEYEGDLSGTAESIADNVVQMVQPGDIIAMHLMYDSSAPSREAVPLIVERLRDEGYSFVTVSELLD